MTNIHQIKIKNFNLQHTLECGQFFRWRKMGGWYYINSRDKFFRVRQKDKLLEFSGVEENFLWNFFSLDHPLEEILAEIGKDNHLKSILLRYHGLRLIRQDPWECLISYLCSTASNIPKIRHCLELLAHDFGRPVELEGIKSYTFPGPGAIKGINRLKKTGVGFRARYILAANRRVDDGYLGSISALPYREAKDSLMELPGVGEKVADCVLLFSLGFLEAFPVDRWIKRHMQKSYFNNKNISNKKITSFAHDYFGRYAGYAQEYLYCLAREKRGGL